MYLHARNWGIQPSEFWGMTMAEWFCEYEIHRQHDPDNDFAGRLTQADVDELTDWAWGDD